MHRATRQETSKRAIKPLKNTGDNSDRQGPIFFRFHDFTLESVPYDGRSLSGKQYPRTRRRFSERGWRTLKRCDGSVKLWASAACWIRVRGLRHITNSTIENK
jgi:hypothetical protein